MEEKDYYQILGVEKNASAKQIKSAYRELAFQFHPDRNRGDDSAALKMKEINEAYAVLSNPEKKRQYNAMRQQFGSDAYNRFRNNYSEQDIFSGSDINHIFEDMARSFGFRSFDDIFKEFYGQGYQTFDFKRPGFFSKGFIFSSPLAQGKKNQKQPVLPGPIGKLAGVLLKKITGVELPEKGADIHDVIRLASEQAAQGGPYPYFSRENTKKIVVKIPPGIREGQRIRLAGMGRAGKNGGSTGDLYLKVNFKRPFVKSVGKFIDGISDKLKSGQIN